ncbi:Clavaminate synthase-like protein, partial [Dothidotthia symphoricarpi CBS 119687]
RSYSTSTRFPVAKSIQYNEANDTAGFDANEPVVFRNSFIHLPAISKWFTTSSTDTQFCYHELKTAYLSQHGDAIVPLELTRTSLDPQNATFERFNAPLSLLLAHIMGPPTPSSRLYLAQHSLADLPSTLQADLPTPTLLSRLGRGDIYASSLWMGRPPTRTPLHRDPNPNLFVQLAGRKFVRLMRPEVGRGVYEKIGRGARANMRGEEMMGGDEMEELERSVWEDDGEESVGVEAELGSGDAL